MNKPPASIKVDWLSFTMPIQPKPDDREGFRLDISEALRYRFPMLPDMIRTVPQGVSEKRKPYRWMMQSNGVAIFYNPSIPHVLIEISGKGCTDLGNDRVIELIQINRKNVLERITRLDIALDIETPIRPTEITAQGYSARFKAENLRREASGETHYIGSSDSDRMCRVYRYNEPHPRAHLLRFEYVTRRDAAKAAALYLTENGLEATIGALEHIFAWKHPLATMYDTGKRIKRWSEPDKKTANTLRWVYKAVFPALERLEHEGALSDVFWQDFAKRFPRSQQ